MTRADIRLRNARSLVTACGGIAEFAKRLGMSDSQASQIAGKSPSRGIGNTVAPRIEDAFGKTAGWLDQIHGEELELTPNVSPILPSPKMRAIPVISFVQAGDPREIVDLFEPGDGMAFEWSDRGSRSAFALVISGDSMAPEFNEGDVIIIDPEAMPSAGRYVVAKCNGCEATFKKYRPRGTGHDGRPTFELVPLNQNYGTLLSDRDHCEVIGVMIEHRIKY